MKLVIITGPHAVGKMTVGQELCRLTGMKLFHNHMTIDVVSDLFDSMPAERARLTELFRHEIFDSFSRSGEYGMVFTYMWAFDEPGDWKYIRDVEELFASRGAQVYYVELEAHKDVRWERNHSENRLLNKPSKRDLKRSDWLFETIEGRYRLNSLPGELDMLGERYMRIDNTDLSAGQAAQMIKERFAL